MIMFMYTNFIIAQVFGALSMASSICSMQFKKRKHILIALLCLSVFAALNMIFLDSFSAAYLTLFSILEMLINYLFERKGKEVPKVVIGLYIAGNIVLGVLTYTTPMDILAIAAAIVFCFSLLVKDEQNIRKLMFLNQLFWLVFDIGVGAYVLVISNAATLVSTTVAYARYNKKNKGKGKNGVRKTKPKSRTGRKK